ncbi:monocarboxylate transporter, putative [Pediculus humanus corporis]|uniref:Monocarboxylate transporter, putative n=1 Tax=Pediculus humanus subsp. corporis TaxID=121224 RepID=E0VAF4_PEDHC|nr:monocarboxylate transporter, putative [Pediculus humanus corporis]EEB10360.1 monocarboxylate transporter, putative [Pediculus humanus corporis]
MTTQSLISVFGLLFIQRFSDLGITTKGASIIMGMQTTSLNLSGLIIGPVIKKYSYRKTAAMGAILVVVGLLLTRHADSLIKFIFSYSLFTGLGLGLLGPSTFVAIDSYFSSRKGRAVGFSVCRGTLLIFIRLGFTGFFGEQHYINPLNAHEETTHVSRIRNIRRGRKFNDERINGYQTSKINPKNNDEEEEEGGGEGGNFLKKLSKEMHVDLIKNPSFANLLIGLALVYVGNIIDYSRPHIALCMSVLSGSDIIGRILVPIFSDIFKIKSKTMFFLGAALSAFARSALVWQKNLTSTLIFASLCGIVRAALICNFNMSISEQTVPEKLPSALGLHMLFKGLAILVFAPVIGFVRDYTKSYSFSLHILNVFFLILPFFTWLIEFICTKDTRKRLPPY